MVLAQSMQVNTTDAQDQLNVDFANNPLAAIPFAAGKIRVRVTNDQEPAGPIEGAQVRVIDGTTTIERVTDTNGETTLEIDLRDRDLFQQRLSR